MNIKLEIEYIGTNYYGWQKQSNRRTIQNEIQENLKEIYGEKIVLLGSGRTDSGVHAIKQIANFHVKKNLINLIALKNKLNQKLSSDIRIKKCLEVSDNFHSQHNCKKKTYLYKIKMVEPCNVFEKNYMYYIKNRLELNKIKEFSKVFIGNHNFIFFCKTGYSGDDTKRVIYSFKIIKKRNILEIKITGNGFLRGMVRLIIGALINFEKDKITKKDIINAVNAKKALKINLSVPACGLYLYDVKY